MKKYFTGCQNLEELKKEYRKLCVKFHPDNGGDSATMAQINAEYKEVFEILKKSDNEKAKKEGKKQNFETANMFIDILNKIIGLDGLEIEICGTWVWIGGNTYTHKDALKNAGFSFSAKKKMWYWKPYETVYFKGKKSYSMETIRSIYGSEKVELEKRMKIEA